MLYLFLNNKLYKIIIIFIFIFRTEWKKIKFQMNQKKNIIR